MVDLLVKFIIIFSVAVCQPPRTSLFNYVKKMAKNMEIAEFNVEYQSRVHFGLPEYNQCSEIIVNAVLVFDKICKNPKTSQNQQNGEILPESAKWQDVPKTVRMRNIPKSTRMKKRPTISNEWENVPESAKIRKHPNLAEWENVLKSARMRKCSKIG